MSAFFVKFKCYYFWDSFHYGNILVLEIYQLLSAKYVSSMPARQARSMQKV